MFFERHAEQQVVELGDRELGDRDAKRDDRADNRGDDAETEFAVADIVAGP